MNLTFHCTANGPHEVPDPNTPGATLIVWAVTFHAQVGPTDCLVPLAGALTLDGLTQATAAQWVVGQDYGFVPYQPGPFPPPPGGAAPAPGA